MAHHWNGWIRFVADCCWGGRVRTWLSTGIDGSGHMADCCICPPGPRTLGQPTANWRCSPASPQSWTASTSAHPTRGRWVWCGPGCHQPFCSVCFVLRLCLFGAELGEAGEVSGSAGLRADSLQGPSGTGHVAQGRGRQTPQTCWVQSGGQQVAHVCPWAGGGRAVPRWASSSTSPRVSESRRTDSVQGQRPPPGGGGREGTG